MALKVFEGFALCLYLVNMWLMNYKHVYLKFAVKMRVTGDDCDEGERCHKNGSTWQDEENLSTIYN